MESEDKRWCENVMSFLAVSFVSLLEDSQVIPDEKFRPGYEKQTGLEITERVASKDGTTFNEVVLFCIFFE